MATSALPSPLKRRQASLARQKEMLRGLSSGAITGSLFPTETIERAPDDAIGGAGKDEERDEDEQATDVLCWDGLMKRWPGRAQQIAELAGLIGEHDYARQRLRPLQAGPEPMLWCKNGPACLRVLLHTQPTDGVPVPPMLITGPPCCGKTSVVRGVLEHRRCEYIYVNCPEVVQRRGLLEAIVEQIVGGSREDILEANRVDHSFRESKQEAHFVEEADWLSEERRAAPEDSEGSGIAAFEHNRQKTPWRNKRQQPACSSWNVFFRQLATLLDRRSRAASLRAARRKDRREKRTADTNASADNGGTNPAVSSGASSAASADIRYPSELPGGPADSNARSQQRVLQGAGRCETDVQSFPPKIFVVLDNAEFLLGESVAGVGVGAGGSGTAGNSWRGFDLLERLARLPEMVSSFTGLGEIMSGGTEKGVAGGMWRSLVARACPVQLRFEPYTSNQLPDVLMRIVHKFGVDLEADGIELATRRGATSQPPALASSSDATTGDGGDERARDEGRRLFRKMTVQLVSFLRNETADVRELGCEASRLWPSYRKMAADGFDDGELAAGLKPLLKEAIRRLHGDELPASGLGLSASAQPAARVTVDASRKRDNVGAGRSSSSKARCRDVPDLGLSHSSKHVLVSAYLASHNARNADRDLFTATGTRRKAKRLRVGAVVGNAENLVEAGVEDVPDAREFQLERLLSIVSSIVAVTRAGTRAANSMGNTELFSQVKSLTRLNLMSECGAHRKSFELDRPSYRCSISRDLAEAVAKDIGIDLAQYLKTG